MSQNERSAMVEACRSGIEDYTGKPLSDEAWYCIMESIYDDAVRSFYHMIEGLLDKSACVNLPADYLSECGSGR